MDANVIKKQKIYAYLGAMLTPQMFIGPILVFFYLNYLNITFSEYLYIDGLLFICVAVTELPSGFIADLFGRKRTLIVSKVLILLSMLILFFIRSFYGGLISCIVLAFASSLGSGNAEAILYESFQKYDDLESYKKLVANKNSLYLIIAAIVSISSGYIAKYNLELILILDIIIVLFSIITTQLFLIDESMGAFKRTQLCGKSLIKDIRNISNGLNNVLLVFIISSFIFCFFRVSYSFYQPLYENREVSVEYYGILGAIFNGLAALGSYLYVKIYKNITSEFITILSFLLILLFSVIGILLVKNYVFVVFIFIQQIIRGTATPFLNVTTNAYIPTDTEFRTTYISVKSSISTIIVSASMFIMGYMNNNMSIENSMVIFSLSMIVCIFVAALFNNHARKNNKIIKYS
ncbi:MAG: MFS transporter [Clostridiales bacterium]|jgi:MFS family permease|nr:MFS transporter [Clostridiales bacterium]